ncbi:MAG: YggT family protein [Clostridiales Family XIII bacterium]|jgi:YggT family protein|nr:YggT family protein [Clostridiales Family XIII bacterium]
MGILFAIKVVNLLAQVLIGILFVQAIMSWFVNPYRTDPRSAVYKIYMILTRITEPMVRPVRKFMSRYNTGPMDFSLIILALLIMALNRVLVRILYIFL